MTTRTLFLLPFLALGLFASTTHAQDAAPEPEVIPETLDWSFWFPAGVKNVDGTPATYTKLEGKLVAIYFSAHWCPPCRRFTPVLQELYDEHKDNLEVVFVSADRSPAQKARYIKEDKMSWLTIDLNGEDSDRLMGGLGIQSFPTLVILNEDAKIITMEGYPQLAQAPKEAWKYWSQYLGEKAES